MKRRGSKESEIEYPRIEMAEYLFPNNEFSIKDQRNLLSMRNRMLDIPSNFVSSEKNESECFCGEKENIRHIYSCKYINSEEPDDTYEKL